MWTDLLVIAASGLLVSWIGVVASDAPKSSSKKIPKSSGIIPMQAPSVNPMAAMLPRIPPPMTAPSVPSQPVSGVVLEPALNMLNTMQAACQTYQTVLAGSADSPLVSPKMYQMFNSLGVTGLFMQATDCFTRSCAALDMIRQGIQQRQMMLSMPIGMFYPQMVEMFNLPIMPGTPQMPASQPTVAPPSLMKQIPVQAVPMQQRVASNPNYPFMYRQSAGRKSTSSGSTASDGGD